MLQAAYQQTCHCHAFFQKLRNMLIMFYHNSSFKSIS